ncbi:MAG: OsmC family protein [Polycyclovorans sp.]|jgi:putative redox protein|nr:peroxiredoxin [Polycyclovorans sp.]MDP1543977.1 OsmC family protein [Polycyclovorans sp.]MEC8848226.1 OsmC family protein [Pseudomonadota bacterium]|tara:strand:- start:1062 stop:1481 length:420 start_codon:yes stop_codon:yes gene_type:complete
MDARVKWVENAAFLVESGSGHAMVVDGPEHIGGRNIGARPMELMLMSVGACSSVDVVYILKKARQPVAGCEVAVKGTRAETEPAVFTDIHLHFIVSGAGLSEAQVKRAVALSAEKYCSASIMLARAGVNMTHTHEVREV